MLPLLLVILLQVLDVPWVWQFLSFQRLQVVSVFPLPRRNSVRSLPIGVKFPLSRVPSGAHDLSKNKVSNLEVFMSDPRVVVFGHAVLVPSEPLFCCCSDLVHQVELQSHSLVVFVLIVVVHPEACEPNFSRDDRFASIRQSERCLSCGCPCRRPVCPQYAW